MIPVTVSNGDSLFRDPCTCLPLEVKKLHQYLMWTKYANIWILQKYSPEMYPVPFQVRKYTSASFLRNKCNYINGEWTYINILHCIFLQYSMYILYFVIGSLIF